MSYRIAVASLDGVTINQHFGRSGSFRIYEVNDDGVYRYLEERSGTPPCGHGKHEEDALQAAVESISDCLVVLVSRIGPGAQQALLRKGIISYAIYAPIEKALHRLVPYLQAGRQSKKEEFSCQKSQEA